MLLPQVRVGHVAHHDVAAAVAELPLLGLGGLEDVLGPGALRLLVGVGGVADEGLDLRPRDLEPAGAPDVAGVGGDGGDPVI